MNISTVRIVQRHVENVQMHVENLQRKKKLINKKPGEDSGFFVNNHSLIFVYELLLCRTAHLGRKVAPHDEQVFQMILLSRSSCLLYCRECS